jgi:hypothetical protein
MCYFEHFQDLVRPIIAESVDSAWGNVLNSPVREKPGFLLLIVILR